MSNWITGLGQTTGLLGEALSSSGHPFARAAGKIISPIGVYFEAAGASMESSSFANMAVNATAIFLGAAALYALGTVGLGMTGITVLAIEAGFSPFISTLAGALYVE